MNVSAREVAETLTEYFGMATVSQWSPDKRRDMARVVARGLEAERLERMRIYRARMAAIAAGEPDPFPDRIVRQGKTSVPPTRLLTELYPFKGTVSADDHDSFIAMERQRDRNPAFTADEIEREYLDLCAEETGVSIDDERQREIEQRYEKIVSQSHAIAERLVAGGVSAYRETPFGVWRYAVHSRRIEKIPAFRQICIIPYVANSQRGRIVAELEYFLECHPFCRFWTFTSGKRVPIVQLRERIRELHRRISRLNAEPFMKASGLEIVFRSTEFGTPETNSEGNACESGTIERDEKGIVLLHPHAHCVVYPTKGHISRRKWESVLRQVWKFWRHHWDDCGSIRSAREACKYVTKPGEMLKLTPSELAALYEATRRIKLVQPMGHLAAEIDARSEKRERLVKKRCANGDGAVYRSVRDWNKHARRSKAEQDLEAGRKLGARARNDCLRILSRSVPGFTGAGLKEPRVTVIAVNFDEAAVRAHPLVARLIAATAEPWTAGLYIRVHTCRSTVRGAAPPESESQRLIPEVV